MKRDRVRSFQWMFLGALLISGCSGEQGAPPPTPVRPEASKPSEGSGTITPAPAATEQERRARDRRPSSAVEGKLRSDQPARSNPGPRDCERDHKA